MTARLLTLILLGLVSIGCANKPTDATDEELTRLDATKLLEQGKEQQEKGNYDLAIENYDKLQSRYPFSPQAQNAQLETAYSYYKMGEPDAAVAATEDFLKTNPRHPRADYAYYLKGLVNQDRYKSMLDKIMNRDIADLDPTAMETAFNDFKIMIRRYPDSEYVDDARQRMIYLRNALARHELNVAGYYVKRGAWIAVANRCQFLLEKYDRSDSMPEALALLARAYQE
ncbi:unnamed protein product, partial [Cyprideis torosa]